MKIREYIDKIGENRKPEDMQKLGDMLSELIYMTKESHPELYEKYKMKLYGMAYNYKFTREMAEEIVEEMKQNLEEDEDEIAVQLKNWIESDD